MKELFWHYFDQTNLMYDGSLVARNEEEELNARRKFYDLLHEDEFYIRLGDIAGRI